MDKDIRVGIALPDTNSHFRKEFVDSFFCMAKPVDCVYMRPQTTGPIDGIRNELVFQALHYECTHIFWCDTDQIIPADAMLKMIDHAHEGLFIVCAKVHSRRPPYGALLRMENPDPDSDQPYVDVPDKEWSEPGLKGIVVDATGFGCCLIDIEVFKAMEKPWFKMNIHEKPMIGEDVYFWRKAKQLGYQILVDLTIPIGHLGSMAIDEKSYFAYKYAHNMG